MAICLLGALALAGCSTQQERTSEPEHKTTQKQYAWEGSSYIEIKTPEQEAAAANQEAAQYRYRYGDADCYETSTGIDQLGYEVTTLVDPEDALEQSYTDYADAYAYFRKYNGLRQPNSGELEHINQMINAASETYIEDEGRLDFRCRQLGTLLKAYRSTYLL